MKKQLVLASSSPRRQALLKQVNLPFIVRLQQVDESLINEDNPENAVRELAIRKGKSVLIKHSDEVIVTADTMVSYQNQIFGKPQNGEEAFHMLKALSGKSHEVYTGVMIISAQSELTFVEKTTVEFWKLSDQEIHSYIKTGEPLDKAGGYGIQGRGAMLVKGIIGDFYNVMGLPIGKLVRELAKYSVYPVSS